MDEGQPTTKSVISAVILGLLALINLVVSIITIVVIQKYRRLQDSTNFCILQIATFFSFSFICQIVIVISAFVVPQGELCCIEAIYNTLIQFIFVLAVTLALDWYTYNLNPGNVKSGRKKSRFLLACIYGVGLIILMLHEFECYNIIFLSLPNILYFTYLLAFISIAAFNLLRIINSGRLLKHALHLATVVIFTALPLVVHKFLVAFIIDSPTTSNASAYVMILLTSLFSCCPVIMFFVLKRCNADFRMACNTLFKRASEQFDEDYLHRYPEENVRSIVNGAVPILR